MAEQVTTTKEGLAWVVAVDMGLGHQRAVFPLKEIAEESIINMQDPDYLSPKEGAVWTRTRTMYESASRAGRWPVIGPVIKAIMAKIMAIPAFYPKKDLSKPTAAVRYLDRQIRKKDMGKRLVEKCAAKPIPLLTSFYAVAIAAEKQGFPHDIYCIICDSDFNRAWLPVNPQSSKIRYFSPCWRVTDRLKMYGVPESSIFTTGFPLPKTNLGKQETLSRIRKDVAARLIRLDPTNKVRTMQRKTIKQYLKKRPHLKEAESPFTLSFAVGGAGAQTDIGIAILQSLTASIKKKKIRLNLIAGVRPEVAHAFTEAIAAAGLQKYQDSVRVVYTETLPAYFKLFNKIMRTTDILWTKPSELSFYTGLGIPVIAAPPIGIHEERNLLWMEHAGAAILQEDPRYTHQWIFDYWKNGLFAELAWNGFLKLPKMGTYLIETVLQTGCMPDSPSLLM